MAADGSVIINTQISNDQYRKGLADMKSASEAWAKGTQADFNSVSKSSFGLVSAIKAGVAAFAGLKSVEVGKDALMAAARYETLGIVVQQAGKNAGYSAEQMKLFQKNLEDTGIAATEARQSLASMSASGIDLNLSAQLARAAQDLAVVAGTNSSEAFERLIQGVQTGNTLILKTLGLNIQWEKSYEQVARAANKTVSQLTEQEKLQARTNAALKEAASYAGIYEASMETAGKQIGSLSRYISNLSVKVGSVGLDALAFGVKDFTHWLKEANAQMDEWEKSGGLKDTSRALGESFKTVSDNIGVAAVALTAYVAAQKITNSETLKSIAANAQLEWQQLRSKSVILDGAKASALKAAAEKAEAAAAVESTKAQIAKLSATRATALATTNAAQAQFARLAVDKQMAALQAQLTAQETRYAAAVTATATATARASLLGRGFSAMKAGFSGLVSFIGGPWVAAITIGATAIAYLATRETAADRVARDHADALDLVKDGLDKASDSTKTFINSLQRLTEVQARATLKKLDKDAKEFAEDMKTISAELVIFPFEFVSREQAKLDKAITGYLRAIGDFSKLSSDELIKVKDDLSALAIAAGRERGMQEYFEKYLDNLIAVRFKSEEINKTVQNGAEKNADLTAKWAEEAAKLAKQTDKVGDALQKIKDKDTPKTIEDAYNVYEKYNKQLDKNSDAATKAAKAQATLAVEVMKTAGKAENLLGVMALMAGQSAAALGQKDLAEMYFKKAQQHYKSAATLLKDAAELEAKIPTIQIKGEGAGKKPAAEVIREIREQIEQLTRTSPETVAEKLAKGLADIAEKARSAQLPVGEVKKLTGELTAKMEEFRKATEKEFLRDFNRDIADMTGNMELVNQIDLEKKLEDIQAKMLALGFTTEQVTAAQDKFKDAFAKQIKVKDLQTAIGFLKELEALSGAYGLSIEKQNELISLQAQMYRDAFPDLKALIDKWEELQKREIDPKWSAGMERSAAKFVAEWTNAGKVAEKQFDILIGGIQDLGGSAIDAIFDKAEFRADQFFKDLAKQLLKIAMNQAIARLLGSFFGSVPTAHSGGIVGVPDSNPTRRISLAADAYVPKFHSGGIVGMSSSEQLTLLQKGEGVFTPAQMRALSPVGAGSHEYTVYQDVSFHIEGGGGGVASAIDQSTMKELSRQMKQATNAAISEFVINQRRAGGMFSGGLA